MLFSVSEIDVLRLLRWCRYIPRERLTAVFPQELLDGLAFLRLIKLYQKHDAYVLTGNGNRFLDAHLEGLPPAIRPSYREQDYEKRAGTAAFFLTAYRAGLSVFHIDAEALEENGACYLTALSRVRGLNPWGSTRVAALIRLGGSVCGVYGVEGGKGTLSLLDELKTLRNNTESLQGADRSLIFTGESSESICEALGTKSGEAKGRLLTYGEILSSVSIPVYLIPCDAVGIRQLRLLSRKNYRTVMTRVALRENYIPPPPEHPEWDALYHNAPLVMAADMDLRRIEKAVYSAQESGYGPISLVCLKGQNKLLRQRYKERGLVNSIFTFSETAESAVGIEGVYTPPVRQYETTKGEVIHAPFIQAAGKDRGPRRG